jgi:diguanylate cyclase (GGDEF)-like protein
MRSDKRLWAYGLFMLGVLGVIGYAFDSGSSPEDGDMLGVVLYLAVAAVGTAMAVAGAFLAPRSRRRIWFAIAIGEVFYFGGDVLWVFYDNVLHIAPYPSVADASYLLRYVAMAIALAWLVRGRRQGRDRASFLDAAIISTGFAVLATVFLIVPAAAAGGATLLSRVVAGAYPVGDVLLLAMLIRLFASRAARSLAFVTLVAAMVTLLVSDGLYTLTVVSGGTLPRWLDIGYLLTYLLMGFCSLHPSSKTMVEPTPHRAEGVTLWRVTILGLAAVIAPTLLVVSEARGVALNPYVIGIGAVVGSTLVLARLLDLLRHAEGQAVQLSALARNDGLTGIANRRTWDHELSRACAQARENQQPLSLALLDLDHFKAYNDNYGHLKGDLVLKESSAAWTTILADRGFLARYGGEEFAVIVPRSAHIAVGLLERMSRAVTSGQTCSVGVATWDGVEDPSVAMARADEALYHAKRSGRNRIAVHDGRETQCAQDAQRDPYKLVSVFQPIVDLATGESVGYEALSRFEGMDPRDAFDEARRTGTLEGLETAAIEAALAAWSGDGWLSLNVSLPTLLEPNVHALLPDDLSRIVLEITEQDLVECPLTVGMLAKLRGRGARIAIDDLGVGFSNLQRLVEVQPEIIKLDMSLVRDLHLKPVNIAMIRAMVAYGAETGAEICAEGIEQKEEWDALVDLGVTLGQGYLFGRPAPLLPSQRRPTSVEEAGLRTPVIAGSH